jgi:hypothetical protein
MTYNVLVATKINGLSEELEKEMLLRLEEACFERIPTLEGAWEIAVDAPDETEAKNVAIDKFVNVWGKLSAGKKRLNRKPTAGVQINRSFGLVNDLNLCPAPPE